MLYIHNKSIDDISTKKPEELVKFAKEFNPVTEDPEFY